MVLPFLDGQGSQAHVTDDALLMIDWLEIQANQPAV